MVKTYDWAGKNDNDAATRKLASASMSDLIVAVATRADRQAFATLFEFFAPRVKSYLLRLGAAPEIAEELAQEALLTVWRKSAQFDPTRAAASTWVFTIARNLRIDTIRKQRRPTPIQDPTSLTDPQPHPDAALSLNQDAELLALAVTQLPADQAEVIRLAFYSDKPHSEIAAQLGLPLGTVKSRLRLAMLRLRVRLGGLQ